MKLSDIQGTLEGFWIVGSSVGTQVFGAAGQSEAISEFLELRKRHYHPRLLVDVNDQLVEVEIDKP